MLSLFIFSSDESISAIERLTFSSAGERWWKDENQNLVEGAAQLTFATRQRQRRHCCDVEGSDYNTAEVCEKNFGGNFNNHEKPQKKKGDLSFFLHGIFCCCCCSLLLPLGGATSFSYYIVLPSFTRRTDICSSFDTNYVLIYSDPLRMCF